MNEKQAHGRVRAAEVVCKPTRSAAKAIAHAVASASPDPSGSVEPVNSVLARNTIQAGKAAQGDEVQIG